MESKWPLVPLGEVLTRIKVDIAIDDATQYTRLTIRLNGNGIVARDTVLGSDIGTKRQFVARTGQLVLSKIDAQNGAFGILPKGVDNAVITGNFWAFAHRTSHLDLKFLEYLTKTKDFVEFCRRASEGTTNRKYLQEHKFLAQCIPLPPLAEQRRIVARLDWFAEKIEEVSKTRQLIQDESRAILRSAFTQVIAGAPRRRFADVAPLVRRSVDVSPGGNYPELGIRSFGKGTFHKPSLDFIEVGTKKLYRIESNDLVFNNVFAWEGAIAVAQPHDTGRVGSHRFITCTPKPDIATSEFLCFYFLTPEGRERIGKASPGGAGRNRTLGLDKLSNIEVPTPQIEKQVAFDCLQRNMNAMLVVQEQASNEFKYLLPSILDRAFKGEL